MPDAISATVEVTEKPSLREIYKSFGERAGAKEGERIFTDRTISHDEALRAAQRLINSHFGNPDAARTCVPADRDHDDDLVLGAYITQRHATDVPWLTYDRLNDVLTIYGVRISGELLRQMTTSPCGVSYRIISRRDGVLTVAYDRDPVAVAAPDLLSAARSLINGIDTKLVTIDSPADETLANTMHRLRAAIAKAESR